MASFRSHGSEEQNATTGQVSMGSSTSSFRRTPSPTFEYCGTLDIVDFYGHRCNGNKTRFGFKVFYLSRGAGNDVSMIVQVFCD